MTRRASATLLLLLPLLAAALPPHAAHPGGIAVLDLGSADTPAPAVRFDGRRVLVSTQDGRHVAIVGIPLDRAPGIAAVSVAGQRQEFDVVPHAYREQHLTVKPSYVNPDPDALERIARERRSIDAALGRFSDAAFGDIGLRAPLPGKRSDSFGSRRFFNNEPRSPHRGMDIAARAGAPIVAPLDARVALQGDFYFTGNTVILDHGQGLLTLYAHLDSIAVGDGERVERGGRLGTVGATGRVTGPHLHFAAYLNGTPVDPALLLEP